MVGWINNKCVINKCYRSDYSIWHKERSITTKELKHSYTTALEFASIWADLANALESFLFPVSKSSPTQTLEEQQVDESLDVKVVEMIRDAILPYANQMPKEFLLQVVSILNKGSIHSTTGGSPVGNCVQILKSQILSWRSLFPPKIQIRPGSCEKSLQGRASRRCCSFPSLDRKAIPISSSSLVISRMQLIPYPSTWALLISLRSLRCCNALTRWS